MFNFLRKKKKDSQMQIFYKTTYEDAFPGGPKQINDEIISLGNSLIDCKSSELIKSILVQATFHLYFSILDNNQFTTKDMSNYLIEKTELLENDADIFSHFLLNKFNSKSIVNSEIRQDDIYNSKTPNEPFFALLKRIDDGYYPLYLVNPTNTSYKSIKKLTGATTSDIDHFMETGKSVSELPQLGPKTLMKIEDIHYTERDFAIWYNFDFLLEDGTTVYKKGSVFKYYNDKDKEYIGYGINQEGWILELMDRPENKSIDEITKTMNMNSRYITYNEDGSIKEEIND